MAKKEKNKTNEQAGLGFGSNNYNKHTRFLNKDGSVNIRRLDGDFLGRIDMYHSLITMSWKRFVLLVLLGYFCANVLFASLYYMAGYENFGNLTHTNEPHDFVELFFFSAQTITTVGYGYVYPKSTLVSAIAAIESMFGLLGFALATGVLYGRFSRPKAHIRYSKHCLIAPYEDITGFMFRMANTTQNELIETEVKLILVKNNLETNQREFLPLTLEVEKISFMALSWTIVHPIDDKSPMYKLTAEDLIKADAEFMILFKAINDTYSDTVYSRTSYKGHELIENAKFKPLQRTQRGNKVTVDLRKLDEIEKF
ncbi:MAG TPA: ion channel [Bacteroidia bacterium]|nr:ion channel [Bacteroidia bacterium]